MVKDALRFVLPWSRHGDSNPGPTHYECVALPTEPCRQRFGVIFSEIGCKGTAFPRNGKQNHTFFEQKDKKHDKNEVESEKMCNFVANFHSPTIDFLQNATIYTTNRSLSAANPRLGADFQLCQGTQACADRGHCGHSDRPLR